MLKEKVQKLIDEALAENSELFLVDWHLTPDNRIEVWVDGDNGLPIEEIVRISRHIEHNLDRETEDFELTISSPGLGKPLQIPRQYIKNVGRELKILTTDGRELVGTLQKADQEGVELFYTVKEPKPEGKGKIKVDKTLFIPYNEIKKATIHLKF